MTEASFRQCGDEVTQGVSDSESSQVLQAFVNRSYLGNSHSNKKQLLGTMHLIRWHQ